MLKKLKEMIREVDEAIEYAELNDHAFTKLYTDLRKERRALKRAIKVFEKTAR